MRVYAADQVILTDESDDQLCAKIVKWKSGMKFKDEHGKTKVKFGCSTTGQKGK